MKKSVLLLSITFRPDVGGVETHLDDLCKYLVQNDYYVYMVTYYPITTKAKAKSFERSENIEIRRIRWIGFNLFHKLSPYPILNFLYLTPYLLLRTFVFLLFKRAKINVIHAQGLNSAFIAAFMKKCFGIRAIMSTQALYNFQKGSLFARITHWVLSNLDKVVAESPESRDELIGIGINLNKIDVFNHWVDQDLFKPRNKDECKRKLNWQEKFIVLFVGRAIPIKGSRALVEIAKKTGREITFAFVSDAGPEVNNLRKAEQENDNVIFIGGVDSKDLWLYYNAADIFVIPSQYEEGVARVVLEALSSGTPIIGSNRGSIPNVLDPSVSIVCEANVGVLQKNIEYLYDNSGKLRQLANNCRNYAVKHFSPNNAKIITNNY